MNQKKLADWRLIVVGTLVLWASAMQPTAAQWIVAHRGASAAAPENTLAAFRLAWDNGADAIEGDFYLTADNRIVAIHDRTTKRTAGVELAVADCTHDQLKQLDVGRWKSDRFRGERIPSLSEVLALVPPGKKILIEIKCGAEIVPRLTEVLKETALAANQTIVISFQDSVIQAVKEQMPHIQAYWLTGYQKDEKTGNWNPSVQEVLETLKRTGADGLDTQANQAVVDRSFVAAIRDAGYELHTWTIDDPQVAQHFQQLGVDSITTNRPRRIREYLRAASGSEARQFPVKRGIAPQDGSIANLSAANHLVVSFDIPRKAILVRESVGGAIN